MWPSARSQSRARLRPQPDKAAAFHDDAAASLPTNCSFRTQSSASSSSSSSTAWEPADGQTPLLAPNKPRHNPTPPSSGSSSHRSRSSNSTGSDMSSSSSPQPRRILATRADWKNWKEVKVRVTNIPAGVSTLDVWKTLSDHGEIVRIEVRPFGTRQSVAYVSFSPPPAVPFWEGELWVTHTSDPNGKCTDFKLAIELMSKPREFFIPSPSNPRIQYPEVMNVNAQKVELGFMYSGSDMMTMKEIQAGHSDGDGGRSSSSNTTNNNENNDRRDIKVSFNLRHREMYIRFWMNIREDNAPVGVDQEFRFRLSLAQMDEIFEESLVIPNQRATKRIWTIPFPLPPLCYRKIDAEQTHKLDQTVWNEHQTWCRQTDVTNHRQSLKTSPITLKKTDPIVDIGRWTVFRLEFDPTGFNGPKLDNMRRALIDWNIKFNNEKIVTTIPRQPCQFWDMLDTDRENSPTSTAYPRGLFPEPIHLEFPVRYQLEVCVSNGVLNEYNITREFMQRLASMDPNRATNMLEKAAENSNNHFFDPMDVFNLTLGRKPAERTIPRYCAYSRSVTITPSAVYVSTPTVEISNRIIREYAPWQDRFLRVRFSDEKYKGKIHGSEGDAEKEVLNRIWRTLRNGITISGRSYQFLAFGNSQFREHGAYFFAPLEDVPEEDVITPSMIREDMGDLTKIREVARYAARMGQCFSTTRAVQDIELDIRGEDDVKRNGFTFTDGVGRLSISVAKHIAEDFGLPFAAEDPPSLFQFRLGGCKGVLAIDPHLEGRKVRVRKSQCKFESGSDGLEVVRWSQFAPATLNRQLIIVLEALGIPGDVFIKRQKEQMSDLTKAMDDEILAQDLLHKNIDFNMMTLTLSEMIANGFMAANDPFTMSILRLWRSWNTKYLKEKAKIFIKDGAFLLGCVDETATLKGHFDNNNKNTYPEIFVQISDPDKPGHYKVIEGICIVARNPSLHPGDIRVVRAVNVPALHHLKNVLVFPQTGDRDLPNMCSGGDLDGDDYIVVWDGGLVPKETRKPMDFTPPPKMFVKEVGMQDIARFFVEYIKNDSLGRIATNHLALADQEEEGVLSDRCLTLAQLHSTAVDYPKSGIPARMTAELKAKRYPHFMTSKNRPVEKIYRSRKILGLLFDQVQQVDFQPAYDAPFDERVLNAYAHSEETLVRADEIKQAYDTAVHRIMAQHGIGTEFEVWSVFILDHNDSSRDYQMAEEFGRISAALKERFQNICIEEVGGRDFQTLAPFVAAMYVVTAKQIEHAVSLRKQRTDPVEMPLMSFPWIFSHILGKIATGDTMMPDFTAQHPTGQRAKKKNPVVTAEEMTEEDKKLMHGERKQHQDLLGLFDDAPRASHQPYKDTLKDVSTMPTEAVSYEDFIKSNEAKTQEDLIGLEFKESNPEGSKENTRAGERECVDEKTLHAEPKLASRTNLDKLSGPSKSKDDGGASKPTIGGSMPLRPKSGTETDAVGLGLVQVSTSPSEPSKIADNKYLSDVLGFDKSPALSENTRSGFGSSAPSSNHQLGVGQPLSTSTSSPGLAPTAIGQATSSRDGQGRANLPQTGAIDTRNIQYICDVLSPVLSSSSGFGSPNVQGNSGSSAGMPTTKPPQQLVDVLVPDGTNSKPKSMKLSSGTGSLPSGLPLDRRLDSSSINFRAGPPGAPTIGIDPKSVHPENDPRPRWSETARAAASPGTIHEVLTEEIDTSDSSSPVIIVGDGFTPVESAAASPDMPSPTPMSSTGPTPRSPPSHVDPVQLTVNRASTASTAAPAQSNDRAEYLRRLFAARDKKIVTPPTKPVASAASTTLTSQSQPQPQPQTQKQTQKEQEESAQTAAVKVEEKEEGEVDDEGEGEEEEVTLEMKPNSTRALLKRFE